MTTGAVVSAPHAHDDSSVRGIMFTVLLALVPCTATGLWLYGWPALNLLVVTVSSSLLFEGLALSLRKTAVGPRMFDGSALLAGWLLAMTLPPWSPWWLGTIGGAIAMLLAKHPFGGLGQNVFNPAIVARVALLLAFPVEMTTWPEPLSFGGPRSNLWQGLAVTFGAGIPDGVTGATLLNPTNTRNGQDALALLANSVFGVRTGSFGETAVAPIALGALLLLQRRIISWHIPVAVLFGILVPAGLAKWLSPGPTIAATTHLVAGGIAFCAVFIATDPATSPATPVARLVYGFGIGATTFTIRAYCALPEGVGFAVLLMNALVPTLDRKLKPRVYGRTRRGSPLPVSQREDGATS